MQLTFDFHNHSRCSYDSVLKPRTIIETARKRGLDGIAITDHGTIRGGIEVRNANLYEDFLVIVGAEIRTEIGDIVGLFLEEELRSTALPDLFDEIHEQEGLVLLPHPGKLPVALVERWMPYVDLVEVWNARSKVRWNRQAAALAVTFGKPVVASSDAHSWFEIGRAYTKLEVRSMDTLKRDLLVAPRTLTRRRTNFYLSHVTSVLTERWKRLRSS